MASGKLTKRQSVLLALFIRGGASRAVDIEDIAVKSAELVPGLFRWKKYPAQIDLEGVRLCAKNLLTDHPPLVSGGVRDGWMLTPSGLEQCSALLPLLELEPPASSDGGASRAEVRQTAAFVKFTTGAKRGINIHDIRALLKVDEYSTRRRRRERMQSLDNLAAGDQAIVALVAYARATFPEEWA